MTTYLSTKAIFEHFEANRRIYVSSRCPDLKKIDKLAPLHLDSLEFRDWNVLLNGFSYELGATGDEIKIIFNGSQTRVLPKDVTFERARDKIMFYLIGRVEVVRVKNFSFNLKKQRSLHLPRSLRIHVNSMNSGPIPMSKLLPRITDSCLPLGELKLSVGQTPLPTQLSKLTDKLVILYQNNNLESLLEIWGMLAEQKVKTVELESMHLTNDELVELARIWEADGGREIGTSVTMLMSDCWIRRKMVFSDLKRRLNGTDVMMANWKYWSFKNCSKYMTVPFNKSSELVVTEFRDCSTRNWKLKMEVMSVGSTRPFTCFGYLVSLICYFISFIVLFVRGLF
ncbi:hypothetical protein GCK72_007266 [Caenorhabditis remanei]|uniref:F-box associated domain-containing protein n=1 Tax=Caenorhabditis remanei TaxID=31234 RepID=A0A6A5HLF0_CAERE|nr:hypothetical protein GCK72_007266 [Caenorhabditis remanei]KAF1767307.1 hypothetical protein GCK72_007266 [Caenorhabditis remanei]